MGKCVEARARERGKEQCEPASVSRCAKQRNEKAGYKFLGSKRVQGTKEKGAIEGKKNAGRTKTKGGNY